MEDQSSNTFVLAQETNKQHHHQYQILEEHAPPINSMKNIAPFYTIPSCKYSDLTLFPTVSDIHYPSATNIIIIITVKENCL